MYARAIACCVWPLSGVVVRDQYSCVSARHDTLDEVPPGSSLPAGRAAADREVNDPTLVRDASNKQPHPIGETRLSTASPALHSAPPWSRFQTQASYPTPASRTPPHPQLPNNVARNSPTAISTFESASLKFRGFQRTPKLTILELRAKFLSYPQISQTAHTKRHKVAQSIHGPQRRAT